MRHTQSLRLSTWARVKQRANAGRQPDAFLRMSHNHRGACLAAWAHAERVHAAFGALAVSHVRSQPVVRDRKAPLAALHACSAAAMPQHHKQLCERRNSGPPLAATAKTGCGNHGTRADKNRRYVMPRI